MIETGQKLPDGTLMEMTADGPQQVSAADILGRGKVALFAVPGAFTPTCNNKHVPGFVAAMDGLKEKGVDAVVCLSVNDPFVMGRWGEITGASEAGIRMVGDPSGAFVKALGLDFSADVVGLIGRARRFAAVIEDGTVTWLAVEESPGEAKASSAEAMLAAL